MSNAKSTRVRQRTGRSNSQIKKSHKVARLGELEAIEQVLKESAKGGSVDRSYNYRRC